MKKIVFVRHAHRDKPHPDQDNGLSDKGREQVKDLVRDFKKKAIPSSSHFWSSPKKRCIETITPLADEALQTIKITPLLDERSGEESSKDFIKRLQTLLEKAQAIDDTVYLCSHGDVIPEAIMLATGMQMDARKGEAIVIEENEKGRWKVADHT